MKHIWNDNDADNKFFTRIAKCFLGLWIFIVLAGITGIGCLIWVIIHFLSKIW
jgi:hypothetical protein